MLQTIPDMWRIELVHPMLVHFPIALLILAALLELVSLFLSSGARSTVRRTSLLLLVIGSLMAWAAVWSGGEAEDVVERSLCDVPALELHEEWALRAAWIFSFVSVIALLRWKMNGSPVLSGVLVTLALAGATALGYTGHLGASLVYLHGAAVARPSAACGGGVAANAATPTAGAGESEHTGEAEE